MEFSGKGNQFFKCIQGFLCNVTSHLLVVSEKSSARCERVAPKPLLFHPEVSGHGGQMETDAWGALSWVPNFAVSLNAIISHLLNESLKELNLKKESCIYCGDDPKYQGLRVGVKADFK